MSDRPTADARVRDATPADALDVRRVLDAAMLEVPDLEARIAAAGVFVAADGESIVGALVVDPTGPPADAAETVPLPDGWRTASHVEAIAVRRRRRGAGIGRALLEAALERTGRLVADCSPDRRDFYDAVGATVREGPEGRCWALVEGIE